ncbi:MAG: hypothetical protein F6K10_11850 [Moorea sp. SIO2B7]|nr:hypothetical protein [Moorena sp. SIO2B7]
MRRRTPIFTLFSYTTLCASRESGVGSRESGVGSRESGVGSRESGVGSRESGAEKKSEKYCYLVSI